MAAQAWATARTAFGRPTRSRDLGVGRGRAGGNCAQRLPDPLLESGAADVERQVEPLARRLDEADDLGDRALERGVAADQLGAREAVLQVAHQRVGIVAEHDGANALVGGGDQDRAERGLADREADRRALAAAPRPRSGSCRARRRRGLIEAARWS